MLKNITPADQKILIYFATAYNKFGENNSWLTLYLTNIKYLHNI